MPLLCSWISVRSCDELLRAELGSCEDSFCTGLCCEFHCAKYCDENATSVRAELELEAFLERPGTTMGTQLYVLQGIILTIINKIWFLAFHSTRRNAPDLRRDDQETGLAACLEGTVPARTNPNL